MNIISRPSQDYVKQITKKTMIVLHYTAGGTMSGAEASLAIRDYVNVPYGVDDDGTIINYFDDTYYAYHTGTNMKDAMCSIGVEVRCWGHLKRVRNQLLAWTGKVIPWNRVVRCAPFRGFEYWEMITPEQFITLKALIADIQSRHPINRIVTHAMLKSTKLDYPPDYPLIKDLLYG